MPIERPVLMSSSLNQGVQFLPDRTDTVNPDLPANPVKKLNMEICKID